MLTRALLMLSLSSRVAPVYDDSLPYAGLLNQLQLILASAPTVELGRLGTL